MLSNCTQNKKSLARHLHNMDSTNDFPTQFSNHIREIYICRNHTAWGVRLNLNLKISIEHGQDWRRYKTHIRISTKNFGKSKQNSSRIAQSWPHMLCLKQAHAIRLRKGGNYWIFLKNVSSAARLSGFFLYSLKWVFFTFWMSIWYPHTHQIITISSRKKDSIAYKSFAMHQMWVQMIRKRETTRMRERETNAIHKMHIFLQTYRHIK